MNIQAIEKTNKAKGMAAAILKYLSDWIEARLINDEDADVGWVLYWDNIDNDELNGLSQEIQEIIEGKL